MTQIKWKKNIFLIISIIVMLNFLLVIKNINNLNVYAAYENTYINTGNQQEDLVKVAETQIGYHEGDNNDTKYNRWNGKIGGYPVDGYGYPWCQCFISWCANQASIGTDIIPKTAGTSTSMYFFKNRGLWNNSSSYGGSYIPKKGDIIYYSKSSNINSPSHVGIVTDCDGSTVYTIEGNYSDKVSTRTISLNSNSIIGYATPNYINSPSINVAPSFARLQKNQNWYDLGDEIELIPISDYATDYWISIFKDDVQIVFGEHIKLNDSFNFKANQYGAGNYYAWISASNTIGSIDSERIEFSIIDGVGYSNINLSKSVYNIKDIIDISVDTICAKGTVIGIDKIGEGRILTENCNSSFSIEAEKLGNGLYGTYFSVYNNSASIDTKWDFFSIDSETEVPKNVSLSKNQYWYDIKDKITLSPNCDNARIFWICIRKDGNDIINTKIIDDFTFDASQYGIGNYYAWISAVNSAGSTDSTPIEFSVVPEASYTKIYSNKEIYNMEDNILITVDTVCAKGTVIGIDKIGEGRILTEECDSKYEISAKSLGQGEYSAYFTVYNGSGGTDTETIKFTILSNIIGDCNNDGLISITDILILKKYILNIEVVIPNPQVADINSDGMVNVIDLILLKHKYINSF